MSAGDTVESRGRVKGSDRGPRRVICVGNATVDRTFGLSAAVRLGTKNPAVGRPIAFGGVARNVAENLVRLDVPVALLAAVGDDEAGRAVLADCRRLGIDVDACVVSAAYPTSQYVAILDPANDLVLGASDMRAIEALPASALQGALRDAGAGWTFADCNLCRETLAELIAMLRPPGHRLAIDLVSVEKGQRLPATLPGVDLLFCNAVEARAYLNANAATDGELAQALRQRGAQIAVMTLGKSGAIVAGPQGVERIDAVATTIADVTGAGDALIAGTIAALLDGAGIGAAVRYGMTIAAMALESLTPVNAALTRAAVRARLA